MKQAPSPPLTIMARDSDRQTTKILIRIAFMNRFNALGSAEIVRVACRQRGKGQSRLRPGQSSNAHSMATRKTTLD